MSMKITKILMVVTLAFFLANMLPAQDYSYIGAAKCKMCHNSEKAGFAYKIWSESLHAKALVSLGNEKSLAYAKEKGIADPTKEASCLKCHSTYHMVGKDAIETLLPTEGVSCESCHGPGSAYKTNTIMKSRELSMKNGLILPTKEVCEKCHNKNNPFYKPFNYDEAVKKIAHPTPKV
jgi:hypothetical protein